MKYTSSIYYLAHNLSRYKRMLTIKWLILGLLIGLISGLLAVVAFSILQYLKLLFQQDFLAMPTELYTEQTFFSAIFSYSRYWAIPLATTSVALLTGFLVQKYIPEAVYSGTDGTDAMIGSFHDKTKVTAKTLAIKSSTSILTISSGASAGLEGPLTQLSSGIAFFVAKALKLSVKERKALLLAGAASGLGAVFQAPLGAAITAIEIVYKKDFESDAILSTIISAATAYSVFHLLLGPQTLFIIPQFSFSPIELIFYVLLGFLCSFTAYLYIKTFKYMKYRVFTPLREKIGILWATGFGGLCMGILAMFFPQFSSEGYQYITLALAGKIPFFMLFLFIFGKMLATSFTIGSGMSGGSFAPALFMGSMTGGIIGKITLFFLPHTNPGSYSLVGMAIFFSCIAHAPIGPLIVISELSQSYNLLLPLIFASATCILLGKNIFLYENQKNSKFDTLGQTQELHSSLFEMLLVRDYYMKEESSYISENTPLSEIATLLNTSTETLFIVQNEQKNIRSLLDVKDIEDVILKEINQEHTIKKFTKPFNSLTINDNLQTALTLFLETNHDKIPVSFEKVSTLVDFSAQNIIGFLRKEDVFKYYAKTLQSLKEI